MCKARATAHGQRLVNQIQQLSNSIESKVSKFVADWFADFDLLTAEPERFTASLSEDIKLVMPDGEFIGHQGFRDWYAIARKTFKPKCQHIVEQLSVSEQNNYDNYTVELRIRLKAESYAESALQGESVNMLVNEKWQLSLTDAGDINIYEYLVEVVNG